MIRAMWFYGLKMTFKNNNINSLCVVKGGVKYGWFV